MGGNKFKAANEAGRNRAGTRQTKLQQSTARVQAAIDKHAAADVQYLNELASLRAQIKDAVATHDAGNRAYNRAQLVGRALGGLGAGVALGTLGPAGLPLAVASALAGNNIGNAVGKLRQANVLSRGTGQRAGAAMAKAIQGSRTVDRQVAGFVKQEAAATRRVAQANQRSQDAVARRDMGAVTKYQGQLKQALADQKAAQDQIKQLRPSQF